MILSPNIIDGAKAQLRIAAARSAEFYSLYYINLNLKPSLTGCERRAAPPQRKA